MDKSTHTSALPSFVIASNTFSTITFDSPVDLHSFAVVNSGRVASLLHILMGVGHDLDGGFLSDMLKVTNDLAYQVQQAVELMAEHADAGVSHG